MNRPQLPPRLEALRKKIVRGRLILALDATASREAMWDMATSLTVLMAEEAAKVGGLDMQLAYYRGPGEFKASPWLSDAAELINQMGAIRCVSGNTQIARMLEHVRHENAREKVSAAVFVGDACEERPADLYAAARDLNVPLFLFQEGSGTVIYIDGRTEIDIINDGQPIEAVFRELARLTGGAYGKFDAGAAKTLGELLRAVAAFATGGLKALANQNSESARLLLTQMRHA
jgi:hypothetical protein